MTAIKILLLDSEPLIREGILAVLSREEDLDVQCATGSIEEALQRSINPDVIVIDPLAFGDRTTGARSVAELCGNFPKTKVVVLTHMDAPEDVALLFSKGAHGYVLKSALSAELIDAVRRVAGGSEYLQPSLGTALLKATQNLYGLQPVPSGDLTPKEEEVLRVLAMGHTNAEAAAILSYAVRTIEGYRARIMRKLGVDNRAELVRAASEMNLLSFPS
ncbi:MAG: response regulator transcription factor [Actinobacteria bacterium]|nr:response regulator transcription factor [Actinomycetota bacterium]